MDDYRQSEVYCQYFSKRGWATETVGSTKILIKKIPFLGTILRIQRGPSSNSLVDIDNFAKKNKALMIFIESDIKTENADYKEFDKTFKLLGYKNINLFLSPTKTTYIDLSKSETAILASFDQDIRKQLKRNSKKNISFKVYVTDSRVPIGGLKDFMEQYPEVIKRVSVAKKTRNVIEANIENIDFWAGKFNGVDYEREILQYTESELSNVSEEK